MDRVIPNRVSRQINLISNNFFGLSAVLGNKIKILFEIFSIKTQNSIQYDLIVMRLQF